MTVSEYGYITTAELEAYTGIDYDTIDVDYTDVFVEVNISIAEKLVNSICIQAPGKTDGAEVATMILSERLMRNIMVVAGYAEVMDQQIKAFFDHLINLVLAPDKYSPAGSVPSQGINR